MISDTPPSQVRISTLCVPLNSLRMCYSEIPTFNQDQLCRTFLSYEKCSLWWCTWRLTPSNSQYEAVGYSKQFFLYVHFGCSICSGHSPVEVGKKSSPLYKGARLCQVVASAHYIELLLHRTGNKSNHLRCIS